MKVQINHNEPERYDTQQNIKLLKVVAPKLATTGK